MMINNYANIIDELKSIFKDDYTGHDIHHTLRVYKLSEYIANKENIPFSEKIQYSALFHDVDDWKLFDNNNYKNLKYLCSKFNIDKKLENWLLENIDKISYKGSFDKINLPIEIQIVQDADRLDAIGAIGIARAFTYGGYNKRILYDPDIPPQTFENFQSYKNSNSTTINHFYEKLLKIKDNLNTDTAKKLAIEKHNFMEQFLILFNNEWFLNFS
ncbi:MAG TPA: HD domain-containing protein [Ignavibacteriales bacterium]|nr:HD domain-containing protein [Ignavibacteriales bacterium]HRR18541.1 HD domain-containing protein [Ignavibacteriales bacterium]HRT98350.1 HD domain-containing protein [Ignavibacteriales bacterium]